MKLTLLALVILLTACSEAPAEPEPDPTWRDSVLICEPVPVDEHISKCFS